MNQLSLTGRTARRRQQHITHSTVSPAFTHSRIAHCCRAAHCCGIPAVRAASFDPSWCLSVLGSRAARLRTSCTRRPLHHHTSDAAPSTSLRKQLQLQRARPSPLLPLPACSPRLLSLPVSRCPGCCAPCEAPLDLPASLHSCIAAFARAPAATSHPPSTVAAQ